MYNYTPLLVYIYSNSETNCNNNTITLGCILHLTLSRYFFEKVVKGII